MGPTSWMLLSPAKRLASEASKRLALEQVMSMAAKQIMEKVLIVNIGFQFIKN